MKREIQIAILAIITLGASIWGFKFISGQNLFSGDKIFYSQFNNVKDVNTATPVLINGFQVGTVISILPESDDISKIRVGLQVKKDIRIPDYTIVELRSSSPLGGREIELVFDKMCDGSNCAEAGSVLEGRTVGILGSLISPDDLDPHMKSITGSINATLDSLGSPDSSAPLDKAIYNLSKTLESLANTSKSFENLMAKSSKNLEVTLSNMSVLTESLVESNVKLSSILDNVDLITEDISKASLSETIEKTNSTFDQASESLKGLEITMGDASATLKELHSILEKITNAEGSLGSLVNDKALYTNIEETSRNLNLLLQDMRLNPRRYFKLFGKKSPEYIYPNEDPGSQKLEDK